MKYVLLFLSYFFIGSVYSYQFNAVVTHIENKAYIVYSESDRELLELGSTINLEEKINLESGAELLLELQIVSATSAFPTVVIPEQYTGTILDYLSREKKYDLDSYRTLETINGAVRSDSSSCFLFKEILVNTTASKVDLTPRSCPKWSKDFSVKLLTNSNGSLVEAYEVSITKELTGEIQYILDGKIFHTANLRIKKGGACSAKDGVNTQLKCLLKAGFVYEAYNIYMTSEVKNKQNIEGGVYNLLVTLLKNRVKEFKVP